VTNSLKAIFTTNRFLIKKRAFKKKGLFNLKYKFYADWEHNMKWFYDKHINHLISMKQLHGFQQEVKFPNW
jgi:hypothetical protein